MLDTYVSASNKRLLSLLGTQISAVERCETNYDASRTIMAKKKKAAKKKAKKAKKARR